MKRFEHTIIVVAGILFAYAMVYFALLSHANRVEKEQKRIDNLTTTLEDDKQYNY